MSVQSKKDEVGGELKVKRRETKEAEQLENEFKVDCNTCAFYTWVNGTNAWQPFPVHFPVSDMGWFHHDLE
jgi:hypothetical protein